MGDGGVTPPPITNRQFILDNLPYYMAIGMTYAEYMHGEPKLAVYYRKADEIRQRRMNEAAWWQGAYFFEALNNAVVAVGFAKQGDKREYPSRPHPITKEEAEAEERFKQQKILEKMNAWAARVNSKHGRP